MSTDLAAVKDLLVACKNKQALMDIVNEYPREIVREASQILKEPKHYEQYCRVYFWHTGKQPEPQPPEVDNPPIAETVYTGIEITTTRHPLLIKFGDL